MSNLRDKIRAKTVGSSKHFRKKLVKYEPPIYDTKEVALGDGTKYIEEIIVGHDEPIFVEVRQPSIGERNEVFSKNLGSGDVNLELILYMAMKQTYVPGTNERVFEPADYDTLKDQPAGGFVDQFGNAALELMNVEDTKQEYAKN